MKVYEVYIEGYCDNGGRCGARYLGVYSGNTFTEAAKNACIHYYGKNETERYFEVYNGKPTFWGCGLYDNFTDAARSFG